MSVKWKNILKIEWLEYRIEYIIVKAHLLEFPHWKLSLMLILSFERLWSLSPKKDTISYFKSSNTTQKSRTIPQSMTNVNILSVPYTLCYMYLVPSPKQQSWLFSTRMIRPTRTEALHGKTTCLLFQLHYILFRGSYPGLYGFHCYPFMTAPAWLTTDVCNISPVEINCFT